MGLLVFHSLQEALNAGFAVYDRMVDGYLVRQSTAAGWAMALVVLKDSPTLAEHPDSSKVDYSA